MIQGFWHQQEAVCGSTLIHTVEIVWGCQHFWQVVPVYVNIIVKGYKYNQSTLHP